MRHELRFRQHSHRLALAVFVSFALGGAQPSQRLEFTRSTLTAIRLTAEPRFQRLLYEDDAYRFVARHYGSGEDPTTPALFVYSKQRDAWIQILSLSTEHARLGRSPDFTDIPLAVNWDYGELINEPFTSMPLGTSGSINFPDRIIDVGAQPAYRLDFNSGLNRDVSLTWFWLSKADLQEAFDGRRTPAFVDPRDRRQVRFDADTSDGLVVPVRVNNGEWLRWKIDLKLHGVLVEARVAGVGTDSKEARVHLDFGNALGWDQLVTVGKASKTNNIGGILGTGLFDRFEVSVDYDTRRTWLTEHGVGGNRETGLPIPIQWREAAPVLRATFVTPNGRTGEVRLCVDVAESRAIVLRETVSAARLKSLHIASFRFDELPVFVDSALDHRCGGVLGNGLLRRFRVTFDRRNQLLVLERGQLFDVPYDYDLTGLTLVANGRAVGVGSVTTGTSAAAAGLRGGDVIVKMDGRPVAGISLRDLRRSFRHDGRERVLTIERLGTQLEIKMPMPHLAAGDFTYRP